MKVFLIEGFRTETAHNNQTDDHKAANKGHPHPHKEQPNKRRSLNQSNVQKVSGSLVSVTGRRF